MRKGSDAMVAAFLGIFLLAGCATKQTVVMVPDADSHSGKLELTTGGGKWVLAVEPLPSEKSIFLFATLKTELAQESKKAA